MVNYGDLAACKWGNFTVFSSSYGAVATVPVPPQISVALLCLLLSNLKIQLHGFGRSINCFWDFLPTFSDVLGSAVAKVCGSLSEVGGLGPLAIKFFSWGPLRGPISVGALSGSPY